MIFVSCIKGKIELIVNLPMRIMHAAGFQIETEIVVPLHIGIFLHLHAVAVTMSAMRILSASRGSL